jgi:hypothetical protein
MILHRPHWLLRYGVSLPPEESLPPVTQNFLGVSTFNRGRPGKDQVKLGTSQDKGRRQERSPGGHGVPCENQPDQPLFTAVCQMW